MRNVTTKIFFKQWVDNFGASKIFNNGILLNFYFNRNSPLSLENFNI